MNPLHNRDSSEAVDTQPTGWLFPQIYHERTSDYRKSLGQARDNSATKTSHDHHLSLLLGVQNNCSRKYSLTPYEYRLDP